MPLVASQAAGDRTSAFRRTIDQTHHRATDLQAHIKASAQCKQRKHSHQECMNLPPGRQYKLPRRLHMVAGLAVHPRRWRCCLPFTPCSLRLLLRC